MQVVVARGGIARRGRSHSPLLPGATVWRRGARGCAGATAGQGEEYIACSCVRARACVFV